MIELTTVSSVIQTTGNVLDQVLRKRGTKITQKINAVYKMQEAINYTQIYIIESNGQYLPNARLSQLWLEAFKAMIPVNKELAYGLRQKSKFWTNPQSWFKEPSTLELVPDLAELDNRCEEILMELYKRIK